MQEKKWGPQSWPFAEILVNLARIKVAQGKLSEAVPLFQRATAIGRKLRGSNPIFSYDQACYRSLLKDRAKAISFLKQAISRGFDAKFRIAHNPDFAYLRGDHEFQPIVK